MGERTIRDVLKLHNWPPPASSIPLRSHQSMPGTSALTRVHRTRSKLKSRRLVLAHPPKPRPVSEPGTLCRGDGGREGVTAAGGRSCCLSSREHKGRAWGPSCGGRRMTERAAHLVDAVLPWVPVRQWVLTVPYRLRYQMAWNHGLSRAVLRVYTHSAHQRPRPEARLENFTTVVLVCHARLLWSVLRIHLVPPMNSVTAAATGSGCSTITKCPARGISTTCTRSPS
jgi:hypothetical protein